MFSYLSESSLETIHNKMYSDIAFDGFQTYLLADNNEICVLDSNFDCIKNDNTCYHTLCYDPSQNCMWAAYEENPGILFQLSSDLDEKNKISLQFQGKTLQNIHSLCCDITTHFLYFVENNAVYRTDHSGNVQLIAKNFMFKEPILDISVLNGNIFCLIKRNQNYHMFLISPVSKTLLAEQVFSDGGQILSTLLYKSALSQDIKLRLLVVKPEGNVSMADYSLDSLLCEKCAGLMETQNGQNTDNTSINLHQLSGYRNICPDWVAAYNRAFCSQPFFGQNISSNIGPAMSSLQNLEQNACDNSCSDEQAGCQCPLCYHQSCSDVIESIALTEASIAHILNAEGEKLQKAIACSSNVSELLRVNESVLKTIVQSTHLEQVLYDKLYTVLNSCPCDCDTECMFCQLQDDEQAVKDSE